MTCDAASRRPAATAEAVKAVRIRVGVRDCIEAPPGVTGWATAAPETGAAPRNSDRRGTTWIGEVSPGPAGGPGETPLRREGVGGVLRVFAGPPPGVAEVGVRQLVCDHVPHELHRPAA